jgi:hypothetical protein
MSIGKRAAAGTRLPQCPALITGFNHREPQIVQTQINTNKEGFETKNPRSSTVTDPAIII